MVEEFKNTEWACVDVFCLSKKLPTPTKPTKPIRRTSSVRYTPQPIKYNNDDTKLSRLERYCKYTYPYIDYRKHINMEKFEKSPYFSHLIYQFVNNTLKNIRPPHVAMAGELAMEEAETDDGWSGALCASESESDGDMGLGLFGDSDSDDGVGGMGGGLCASDSDSDGGYSYSRSKSYRSSVVKSSYAVKVSTGRTMQRNTIAQSNVEFNYDVASVPCILSLSIKENLVFNKDPPKDELITPTDI